MKKLVLAGLLALTALGLSAGNASAFYPCYDVYQPCWQIPIPKFPLVIPNIKLYCAECCPPKYNYNFAQPWYLYYPPHTYTGYNSPWMNYSAPHAYPYAAAPQNPANYAGAPAQGYPAPQAAAQYSQPNHQADRGFAGQGAFAPPAYWYGR